MRISHVDAMFGYLASEFETIDAFFTSYYASGTQVPTFVASLIQSWPGFIPALMRNKTTRL